MRQFLLLSTLMLTGAALVDAQTAPKPKFIPPIQTEELTEETIIEEIWEPEYHLEAWVATIKTHYAAVQAMASQPDAAPVPLDPNLHAPMVIRKESTQ